MSRASDIRRWKFQLSGVTSLDSDDDNDNDDYDEENDVDGTAMSVLCILPSEDDLKGKRWIATTFKKKECVRYVRNIQSGRCYCGRPENQHMLIEEAPTSTQMDTMHNQEPWGIERDVKVFPNDSFGRIQFLPRSAASSKYVRLSNDTNPKDVLNLLLDHWKLPKPHLVISVIGGKTNFTLNKQDQDTFKSGLVKVAQSVDTWIISSGVYCGVHKAVGEAVRECQPMTGISNKGQPRAPIQCIGITPWGYVENFESLVGKKGKGCYPAQYKVNPSVQRGEPVSLDPHHTHFLLVDDGTGIYDCEIAYRVKLEQAIKEPENHLEIPLVKVCVEGGMDTILATKEAVQHKTPVVLCEGTGRAADLLALAIKNCATIDGKRIIKPSFRSTVSGMIHRVCNISENHDMIPKLIEAIDVIMEDESMITIFNMKADEQAGLDLAILDALLKGHSASPGSQLKLTLSWGRVDVAEKRIMGNTWLHGSLDAFVTQALMENRVDFIRLFLEKGAIMKDYLTLERLEDLYNKVDNKYIRISARGQLECPFHLRDVRSLIHSLTEANVLDDMVGYIHDQPTVAYESNDDQKSVVKPDMHFQHPFTELFLWAVLVSRMDLAELFWEHGDDPVCLAIVASRLCRSMSKRTRDPDDQQKLCDNSRQFEKLAISVIDECFDTNEELAQMMIDLPHDQWGGKNTLKIAAKSEAEEFISSPCAQTLINNIWMDGIRCSTRKAFLVYIFPLLLLVIPYRGDFVSASIWKKAWMFYNAPVSKFFGGLITYLLLLFLFSYVLIFNFESRPSFWENILFGWICTLIIEEIRQFVIPNERWYEKIRQWKRSVWNWIDAAILSLACLGYGLHWGSAETKFAKGCFCASCFLFYVRLLRIYAVSTRLGPKMVMIRKMIMELLYFLCMLLVFMIGYGVASQSLLFPNQRNVVDAITGVFYMPYFQILGELFLDVSVEGKLEDCSNNPDDNLHPCPEKHLLVSILLVIYLLVGNVLLLNLLIAIFSSVFDEIQSKALLIWKYEQYALVMEYVDRPALAAPFIVIEHIYMTIRWMYIKAMKSCGKQQSSKGLPERTYEILRIFEKVCSANYRFKKANIESSQVCVKVDRNEKTLKELLEKVDGLPRKETT